MLDAFIIDRIRKEKRREHRREIEIPLYIEEPVKDEEVSRNQKRRVDEEKKYYERIDIKTE